jgi:signal transduction histidine kinase
MKTLKEHRKIFFKLILLTIIFFIITSIINLSEYVTYNNIVNNKINDIVSNLDQNTDSSEIVDILSSDDTEKVSILAKYNFDKDASYISLLNKEMHKSIIMNFVIAFIFVLSAFLLIYIYLRKRDKDIESITEYINKINNGNYSLNIIENDEDEISKLKNELYKITVSLKETAEINRETKENLSNSIADVSHQIKTPLTTISILLDNINDTPDMNEETKKDFLSEITKQVEVIKFMTITILKLARFDAGVVEYKVTDIKVKKLVKEIKKRLDVLLDLKDIDLVVDDNDVSFMGDFNWESEALTNIVKNCIEASDNGEKIKISSSTNSVFTQINIEDHGHGIAKKDLHHIFERFYKTSNAQKESYGIGLNLAKNIIEKDNGYITVSSVVGQGTKFVIRYLK